MPLPRSPFDMAGTSPVTHRFLGQVALVTGAASGIGARVAERLLTEGGHVCLVDLDVSALQPLVDRHPERTIARSCDVRDDSAVAAVFEAAKEAFGTIDLVVHAAGVATAVKPVQDQGVDDFRRVMGINVEGTFVVLKHAARAMIAREPSHGVIVNISSVNAVQASAGMSAYCTSKAAVAMLTRAAALDLAPHGIRVVDVAPGLIETPMTSRSITSRPDVLGAIVDSTPLGRIGTTDDVASAVLFLASPEASFTTGSTFFVDGGIRLRPPPARART